MHGGSRALVRQDQGSQVADAVASPLRFRDTPLVVQRAGRGLRLRPRSVLLALPIVVLGGCGSEDTGPNAVRVSPASASLQVGDTARFAAEVRFAAGGPGPDRSVQWSSSDTAVVSVTGAGAAVAMGPGAARIYARAGSVSGRAYVGVGVPPEPEVLVPSTSVWVDRGVVLEPGAVGAWDRRLNGASSPAGLVRKDGRYYLYYIGASGDRVSDGGPAYRSLGVAVSTDGITFTKHPSNPVIEHFPDGGYGNVEEEGIFSAGIWTDDDGTIVLYFGGMESTDHSSVDGDGVLATSVDGVRFTVHGDVIAHDNPDTFNHGDEIFPVAAYKSPDGVWHCYYVSKGHLGEWILGWASGSMDRFVRFAEAIDVLPEEIIGAAGVIELSPERLMIPLRRGFEASVLELRMASPFSPSDLTELLGTWEFEDLGHAIVHLDRERRLWLLYYLSHRFQDIRLKTAPLRLAE